MSQLKNISLLIRDNKQYSADEIVSTYTRLMIRQFQLVVSGRVESVLLYENMGVLHSLS